MTYYFEAAEKLNVSELLVKYLSSEANENFEEAKAMIKTDSFRDASRAFLLETGLCFTGFFNMYASDFYEMYA